MARDAMRQLYAAIEILSSSPETTPLRLGKSYQLHLSKTSASDFPDGVRPEVRAILEELQRMFPVPGSSDGVTETQAAAMARRILNAYNRLLGLPH